MDIKRDLLAALGLGALLCAAAPARAARDYHAEDRGAFASTGRFVEMSDRYGWQSYEIVFDFSLDGDAELFGTGATLELTIKKLDGGSWSYRCKQSRGELTGRAAKLYGRGISVTAECKVPPKRFAGAVGVDWDMVGQPTLVFQALVKEGKAVPGFQKGFYVLAGNNIEGSEMAQYVTPSADPTNLSVLFASGPTSNERAFNDAPRFIP